MYLAKSDFIRSLSCKSSMWFSKYQPEKLSPLSESDSGRIEQGNLFESLVRSRFPEGVLVDGYSDKAAEETQNAIDQNADCLFQATAIAKRCLAKADILERVKDSDSWNLFEVKSSTRVKAEHILDAAFQTWVFEQSGFRISQIYLILVDNTYQLQGEIDISKISKIEEITNKVRDQYDRLESDIKSALDVLTNPSPPEVSQYPCGLKPDQCQSGFHCYPELPVENIFTIPRINFNRARELYNGGVVSIHDYEEITQLSPTQKGYVEAVQSGKPQIDCDAIQLFLDRLEYPLSFLDYESASPAVPAYTGYRPYSQVVFQYSLHVIREPGSHLEHYEYLDSGDRDPALDLSRSLRKNLPSSGSVLVWNESFEKTRNREMGEHLPEYHDFYERLNDRVIDLMRIVSEGHYLDPGFLGRSSIKSVLPVLVPQMSYNNLEINNGGLASLRWLELLNETNSQKAAQIRQHLLEYCKLDTLAMVELFHVFTAIACKDNF